MTQLIMKSSIDYKSRYQNFISQLLSYLSANLPQFNKSMMLQGPLKSAYLFFWYPEHKKVLKVINLLQYHYTFWEHLMLLGFLKLFVCSVHPLSRECINLF